MSHYPHTEAIALTARAIAEISGKSIMTVYNVISLLKLLPERCFCYIYLIYNITVLSNSVIVFHLQIN